MNLIERAKQKSAAVVTREMEIAKIMIHALIPMPKGDIYVKEVVNTDGSVDKAYKPLQLIPDTEDMKAWKLAYHNLMVKYQFMNEEGKPAGAMMSDFITDNRIINPMTVYDEVKATAAFSTYVSKKGTPEESEEVQLYSITCSTANREFQLKNNTGNLIIL